MSCTLFCGYVCPQTILQLTRRQFQARLFCVEPAADAKAQSGLFTNLLHGSSQPIYIAGCWLLEMLTDPCEEVDPAGETLAVFEDRRQPFSRAANQFCQEGVLRAVEVA